MNRFYIACDLGIENARVMLGTLHNDTLTISETRRISNAEIADKKSGFRDIPRLYEELLASLREISNYEEPIHGLSCYSEGSDYLLFEPNGAIVLPACPKRDPRGQAGIKEVFSKISWEAIYQETGIQQDPGNTLFQLGTEKSRRLKRNRLLPIADGFNFLLSGVQGIERSSASATQLYNPATRSWSERVLGALRLSPEMFPPVVPAGTRLGSLRAEILKEIALEELQVLASCSQEIAGAIAGLPVTDGENWAFLRTGNSGIMGTQLVGPIIDERSRDGHFTNQLGYGNSVLFHKNVVGLWILEECKRFWNEKDRGLGDHILTHLAIAADPFESLVDPTDPSFQAPGDMPLKIQAFCRKTGQSVPRKAGAVLRCVLESIALSYRKTLDELEDLTGRKFTRLFLLDGSSNDLLNHFIANALQIPVVIVTEDAPAVGSMLVQAVALGHVESLQHARKIAEHSFKSETINPHATVWNDAYERLAEWRRPQTSVLEPCSPG
jgi:rhamnulokinase